MAGSASAQNEQYNSQRQRRRRTHRRRRQSSLPTVGFLYLFIILVLCIFSSGNSISSRKINHHQNASDRIANKMSTLTRSASSSAKVCKVPPGESTPFLKSKSALALYIPGIFVLFIGLAVITDDYFVPSLERICEKLNLSPNIAGATFMAAGSSAPELFTSLLSTFVTKDDIGVGTIVGSAVFNILVIVGVCALMAGKVLKLDWRVLVRDSVFYIISICLLFTFVLGSSRAELRWWEGLVLVGGYVGYIVFMAWGNDPWMEFAKRFMKDGGKGVDESGEGGVTDLEMGKSMNTIASLSDGSKRSDSGFSEEMEMTLKNAMQRSGRFKNLNSKEKLIVTSRAIIAANRFAKVLPSKIVGDDEFGKFGGVDKKKDDDGNLFVDISLQDDNQHGEHHRRYTGSHLDSDDSDDLDDEEKGRRILGIEVPESVGGKIIFPITFVWKLLFKATVFRNCCHDKHANWWPFTFIMSIVWIGAISYAMVEAARYTGCLIGVPSAVMGLTVLAAGTSVPDALASVAVAKQGEGDMAVSNALGSNVFDILLGLGLPIFLGELIKKEPLKVTVEPLTTVVVPIVILFAGVIVLLGATAAMKWKMTPKLGIILILSYVLFLVYAFLEAFVINPN